MSAHDAAVVVDTAARLHFGVLDLRRSRSRWFGGIGAAAPGPRLRVSVRRAARLRASGDDADRAAAYAERFLHAHRIRDGAQIIVETAFPRHAGLGSGTQLALAVARGLARLFDVNATTPELARAVGRAERSAVGTWTFDGGGLVVEGGRRPGSDAPGPLLARLRLPRSWECVVAIPKTKAGLTGEREEHAFRHLPEPPASDAHEVAHLVLMSLLPAVVENDLGVFGHALTRIQEITGSWFAPAQGGTFHPGPTEHLIQRMKELGACGVGQSSWGPAAYGIVEGEEAARRLDAEVRNVIGRRGVVFRGAFPQEGARVWREP